MPHSSGGGSHSGGSHGGSYSSGGSSSSRRSYTPPPLYSNSRRFGYSRYAFYEGDNITYRYVRNSSREISDLIILLFALPFILIGIAYIYFIPTKIEALSTNYDTTVYVDDWADILSDSEENAIYKSFIEFQNKTGITPALVTDYNSSWIEDYESLEDYAYDIYVNNFDDESHWLIVYTEPETPDADFNDWYWEGMQGNNTDAILSSSVTDDFNESMQKYLTKQSYSLGDAVSLSFDELTDNLVIGKTTIDFEMLVYALVWNGILILVVGGYFWSSKDDRKKLSKSIAEAKTKGIKVDEYVLEDTCEYCGGVYIHGKHIECPHCGAPIKPMNKASNS
ncbi:MAG: TPM domain-containing protein [Butyrivibrio sp.]|nr:TPM domain-containing protein [Butyrivibrio sp.]